MSGRHPIALVAHDDGDALDSMTRLFEARGWDVVAAVTAFRAQALLEGERPIDVVVAPWDARHVVGGELYRWALQRRSDLRDRFVFLGADVPEDFDRVVAGRCLLVPASRPAEIVRVASAALRRRAQVEERQPPPLDPLDESTHIRLLTQPRLLLADDDPILLIVIAEYLEQAGYTVTRADNGHAAIVLLSHEEFHAIVLDWDMHDGSGADVFAWIVAHRPSLAARVAFLASGDVDDVARRAPGRPCFHKGQDAQALIAALAEIVRQARDADG